MDQALFSCSYLWFPVGAKSGAAGLAEQNRFPAHLRAGGFLPWGRHRTLGKTDLGREFFCGKTRGSGGGADGAGYVPVTPWGTGGHQQELGDLVCARNEPFAAQSQNTAAVEAGASWAEPRC